MKQVEEGKPVEMAASSSVVAAFLDYLYGGEPDVTAMDSVELLHLASAYDLPRLATTVERDLRDALDSAVALQLLLDSQTFGFSRFDVGLWKTGGQRISEMLPGRRLFKVRC